MGICGSDNGETAKGQKNKGLEMTAVERKDVNESKWSFQAH
jgi:hypothetical protein